MLGSSRRKKPDTQGHPLFFSRPHHGYGIGIAGGHRLFHKNVDATLHELNGTGGMVKWRRRDYRRIDVLGPQIGRIPHDSRHPISLGKFSAALGVAIHHSNQLNSFMPC